MAFSLHLRSPLPTPEREGDDFELEPVEQPFALASLPNAIPSAPPTTEIGSLDLTPCSIEDYLDIDASVFGKYEYVEGILVALPMAEEPHDRVLRHVLHRGNALYLRGDSKHLAGSQQGLAIPRSPSSSGNPSSQRRIRRPDVSIGRTLSPETREQLSPKSKRITHPLPGQVDTVVEVTSKNESTDTMVKVAEYERAGTEETNALKFTAGIIQRTAGVRKNYIEGKHQ
ncbi:Restriction endonuclease type II-like protein [Gracilaria domingensis]|nr:Restriction endonuclease type II-like protein [Gracilaria domingensis]